MLLSSCLGEGSDSGVLCDANMPGAFEAEPKLTFGVPAEDYTLFSDKIKRGETVSAILSRYGVSVLTIDKLDKAAKGIFPLSKIRVGQPYTLMTKCDTADIARLDHMVYELNKTDYLRFSFLGDSISVVRDKKPITSIRRRASATIDSSMWGAMMEQGLPYELAAILEDTYQWTVNFFNINKGDSFSVIYDEQFVDDSLSVGVGTIWGAKFTHQGKDFYAIPFKQGSKVEYWEDDGGSLRKQMLKAPLKYSRISSKFSYSRLHPIHKVYKPHTGVDYAAPIGTPVVAVADGVVSFRGWGGGGGNTLKIKHAGNMTTGYLHLSGYAKGIVKGAQVSQGQVIGYVGSTGDSTGPHLDYRVWKGTTPINPLTMPQEPSIPISEDNREAFEYVKNHIIAEIEGSGEYSDIITNLDSLKLI